MRRPLVGSLRIQGSRHGLFTQIQELHRSIASDSGWNTIVFVIYVVTKALA